MNRIELKRIGQESKNILLYILFSVSYSILVLYVFDVFKYWFCIELYSRRVDKNKNV